VLAQDGHVVAIPGTKRLRYLEENCQAAGLVLSAADLADLDAMPPASGDRY
jgi:aryl-alcohol dehydrogenase-like predicted oxidoreductase